MTSDLLIVVSARANVFRIVERLGSASVEMHLDRRRRERRQASFDLLPVERRRRERRIIDVSKTLRTQGWAFISGAQRASEPPAA